MMITSWMVCRNWEDEEVNDVVWGKPQSLKLARHEGVLIVRIWVMYLIVPVLRHGDRLESF